MHVFVRCTTAKNQPHLQVDIIIGYLSTPSTIRTAAVNDVCLCCRLVECDCTCLYDGTHYANTINLFNRCERHGVAAEIAAAVLHGR